MKCEKCGWETRITHNSEVHCKEYDALQKDAMDKLARNSAVNGWAYAGSIFEELTKLEEKLFIHWQHGASS